MEDHQFRTGKKPLFRFRARRLRGTDDRAQMLHLSEVSEVLQANSGHTGHLIFGE
jgi:hypothetical protein